MCWYLSQNYVNIVGLVSPDKYSWYDFVEGSQLFILPNSDLTFYHAKPSFPNVIAVEGISIEETKPLPKGKTLLCSSFLN